jgi:hypothetical protein
MITEKLTPPVDVFVNASGEIVLCQEWPEPAGEKYMMVFINTSDAEIVCREIMAAVRTARRT